MARARLVLVAVIGSCVAAVLLLGGLVTGMVAATDEQNCVSPFYVPVPVEARAPSATGTTHILLEYSAQAELTLTSIEEVTLPLTSPYAQNLLSTPESPAYRQTMSCLFEYFDPGTAPTSQSRRAGAPQVRVEGGRIVATDVARNTLSYGDDGYVAVAGHAAMGLDGTALKILVLRNDEVGCAALTVEAPPGWLAAPDPWPPTAAGTTSVTWAPCGASVLLTVRPGVRENVVLAASRPGFAALAWGLGWICYPLLALAAVILVRRILRATGAGEPDAPPPVIRLLVPVIVLSTTVFVLGIVGNTTSLRGESVTLLQNVLVALAVVWCAWRWRLDRVVVVVAAVGIVAALVTTLALLASADGFAPETGTAGALIGCSGVVLYLVTALLVAGVLNAVRLLRPGPIQAVRPRLSGELLCWGAGVVVAAAVVVERYWNGIETTVEYFTVSRSLPLTAIVPPISGATVSVVLDALGLVVCLLPLGVLRAVYWRIDGGHLSDRVAVLVPAAVALLIYAQQWTVSAWSWTVPIVFVLAPITVFVLMRGRSLSDREEAGTMRELLESTPLDELRVNAHQWRARVSAGRRLEASVLMGETGVDEHARHAEQMGREDERIVIRGDPDGAADRIVTPVDVVLAAGPGGSPLGNARQMGFLARRAGVVVNLGLVTVQAFTKPLTEGYQVFTSRFFFYADVLVTGVLVWTVTGFAVGLLWRRLPGRRGPTRLLLPLVLVTVPYLVGTLVTRVAGEPFDVLPLIQLGLLWASMMVIAVIMDVRAMRPDDRFWTTRRQAFVTAYGTQNLPAQTAFVLAQASAVIAIITFVITVSTPAPSQGVAPPTVSSSSSSR